MPQTKEPPQRVSHAERRERNEAKIFNAAIECLCAYGYGQTTTVLVADRAGVSRGALLHRFPTRAALIVALCNYMVAEQNKDYQARLEAFPAGMARFKALTDIRWDQMKSPQGIALLEIILGSRSDPELHERLPQVARDMMAARAPSIGALAAEAGVPRRRDGAARTLLNVAAMRGLALELMFSGNEAAVEDAFALLKRDNDRALADAAAPKTSD